MARSRLQQDVLLLFRRFLKWTVPTPPPARERLRGLVRAQFQKNRGIPRNNLTRIEYLLRRGKNQLTIWGDATITDVRVLNSGQQS